MNQNAAELPSALVPLGFTELEAAVYAYLLTNSPVTGYRVAHDIDKPVANTYKAVESLQQKGAVMVDESGGNRLVRAAPLGELLDHLRQIHERRSAAAKKALGEMEPVEGDIGLYKLGSTEQVFQRARTMLERARQVVLADVFPRPLERLRPCLEQVAENGVALALQVYEPVELEGIETFLNWRSEKSLERWQHAQWINVVVDGAEFLIACLSSDGQALRQAIWSKSPYVAWAYHSALWNEILMSKLHATLTDESCLQEMRSILESSSIYITRESIGYRQLEQDSEKVDTAR